MKNENTADLIESLLPELNTTLYSPLALTKGYKAIVDNIYLEQIMQFSWFAVVGRSGTVYARTTQAMKGKQVTLQSYVWGLHSQGHYNSSTEQLTFKNKITLDCRFRNILRYTGRQNVMRYRGKRPSASKFKGVKPSQSGKFSANIYDGNLHISLGTYDSEEFAGKVYDEAARILFGGAGYLNFPDSPVELSAMEVAALRIQRARVRSRQKPSNS
ncbi:AP2/ERF family transcription factor [Shimia sp. FJ5]|uniref:AP2/ERF family transcription factor n=1 Tax=Shimia sp. FJ5 TaxID=3079054 RepID=UPI0026196B06|nr:AP2/ERF family transcription factor [Shimia sp. FJ5]MDV4144966.1 AP2/ERF family transcription factor [Shimia sp. FJ5]